MKTLTVNNLLYEELVMLQDIMVMVDNMGFTDELDPTEREIFSELYNKIIQS